MSWSDQLDVTLTGLGSHARCGRCRLPGSMRRDDRDHPRGEACACHGRPRPRPAGREARGREEGGAFTAAATDARR